MELELQHLAADIRKLTAAVEALTRAVTETGTPTPTERRIVTRTVAAKPRSGRMQPSGEH